jgi:integrase/recombinase XerD
MSMQPDSAQALVPAPSAATTVALPEIVQRAGQAAVFAAEEFSYASIRNEHTRTAYRRAVNQFLAWCQGRELELARIAPRDVGQYFDSLRNNKLSIATRKQHLAAIRHFRRHGHAPRHHPQPGAFGTG